MEEEGWEREEGKGKRKEVDLSAPQSWNNYWVKKKKKNNTHQRLPDGPVIKTSPFNAEGAGLIPGRGAKIPHGLMAKKKQNTKQKQYCNTFNKDLKKKWSTSKNSTIRPS